MARPKRPRADDEWSTCQLARSAGGALVARAAAAGLVRDDIDIADVLDLAAAIAWVAEQPERDAGQRDRLLRVVVDGLRPANAPVWAYPRSAVMCMSTVPWHAPLKISVCMVPESDPSSWGV
jgi:hypothetical protein